MYAGRLRTAHVHVMVMSCGVLQT